MSISFKINEKPYTILMTDNPIDVTLNTFIREHTQLTGTKFMCLEGGCGVCICVIKRRHPVTKEIKTFAVNSCLILLNSCDGYDITTIEGIGNKQKGYHAIQKRLARLNGTQCGYCSPGMVMNMYALIESKNDKLTMEEVENSFGGNLCRCTGYRPILDAMKSFATDYVDIEFPNEDIDDIEDIKKLKSCQNCQQICPNLSINQKNLNTFFKDGESKWCTSNNLNDIFNELNQIGNKKYMLVAGNTAHGVFRRPNDIQVFIDVNNVQELHEHKIGDVLELGANLSLTETMDILLEASKIQGFEYCQKIYKHFDLVANVPVRNAGTLAGNLSIKHQHPEFPSDIFILLESIDAKMNIMESPTNYKTISVLEYIKTDMNKKIIRNIILKKFLPTEFLFKSYKIMPRAQNAHAYVNAAFQIQLNKNKIVSARLCFGGISTDFIHAVNTEKFLIQKDILQFNNKTLQDILKVLNEELKPTLQLPDTSPEYRKILACGLFYKFILSCVPKDKISNQNQSGKYMLKRNLSSGTQTFETNKDIYPATKPMPKVESLVQCSGEAKYMNDHPKLNDQLWAVFVHSTKANSKLAQIDASEALKIPGVFAFYSAKDIPGKNSFVDTGFFGFEEDEEIFASSKLEYYAQPIGMIVADDLQKAHNAALKVKVIYENTGNQVMATLQDVLEHRTWQRFKHFDIQIPSSDSTENYEAEVLVQGTLDMGSQYHFTMEPQTTVCVPVEDGIDVYSATQHMDLTQVVIAKAIGVPVNKVYLQVRRIGGGYGGKISRGNQVACACAIACYKLNRPVRFVQSIESMMSSLGKRFACRCDYDVRAYPNGKIATLKNTFWEDSGYTLNENPVDVLTLYCSQGVYDSTGWKLNGKAVKTDAPSHTWCRAPGGLEGVAMIENIMEHISREINKDPVDVRMANISKNHKMYSLLPKFVKSVSYKDRKQAIDEFNKKNRWKKRGIAISLMQYPSHYLGNFPVLVSIYHADGTVCITHGGIEMGQGLNTKVIQCAAYILGIPMEKIRIRPSDTMTAPNAVFSGAGMVSEAICFAVKKACTLLLNRMKPIRDSNKNAKWEDITRKCFEQNIILIASETFKFDELKPYETYGLACTEIEIDILTGNLILNRVDILLDAGESMNPMIDVGQIEGAFIMGIGYWLTEQLIFNRQNGELLTTRTWNYKIPGAKDIPVDFRINLLQKSPNPVGFMRAKRVGEPPIILAVSVIFAIRHALDSARSDAGQKEKWYHLGAPTTPEHIVLASGNSIENFNLT